MQVFLGQGYTAPLPFVQLYFFDSVFLCFDFISLMLVLCVGFYSSGLFSSAYFPFWKTGGGWYLGVMN